jgi:HEAT repeat protein
MARRADDLSPAERQQVSRQLSERLKRESQPAVRLEIVKTLGSYSTSSARAGLQQALQDGSDDLRIEACRSLAQHQSSEACQMLCGALQSETHTDVRLEAVTALGQFKDPYAMEALGQALDDGDPAVQYLAMRSLKEATGEDAGNRLADWKQVAQRALRPQDERTETAQQDRDIR